VISGFRVSWDSRRPPGQRVLGVWLQEEQADDASTMSTDSGFSTPTLKDGDEISPEDTEPILKILTREYMAQGHDGFTPLKGNKYLIDDESGQITSAVVRKYLLGSSLLDSAHKTSMPTSWIRITICKEASQLQQVPGSSTRRNH
jgi:5'-nucleotidase